MLFSMAEGGRLTSLLWALLLGLEAPFLGSLILSRASVSEMVRAAAAESEELRVSLVHGAPSATGDLLLGNRRFI